MSTTALLNFYTVSTTADQTVSETALYLNVAGQLDSEILRVNETDQYGAPINTYVFFPNKILSGISFGIKVTSGSTTYIVQTVETFDDHQEIILRKVN